MYVADIPFPTAGQLRRDRHGAPRRPAGGRHAGAGPASACQKHDPVPGGGRHGAADSHAHPRRRRRPVADRHAQAAGRPARGGLRRTWSARSRSCSCSPPRCCARAASAARWWTSPSRSSTRARRRASTSSTWRSTTTTRSTRASGRRCCVRAAHRAVGLRDQQAGQDRRADRGRLQRRRAAGGDPGRSQAGQGRQAVAARCGGRCEAEVFARKLLIARWVSTGRST